MIRRQRQETHKCSINDFWMEENAKMGKKVNIKKKRGNEKG